ncbi:Dyggve-Melchior-Clausen syndrome protein-domain-containing protein [Parasitella parasitica]|nr:Dyggve-Melchior-Clausen syndrome protein-domain-containing protein [Parasitella parasitica]
MNSQNLPSLLTAPNKTLAAPPPTSRRSSSNNNSSNNTSASKGNAINSPSPRSPSLELSDSFSVLSSISPIATATTHNVASKFAISSHHSAKSPTEQHGPFFSPSQLSAVKPICSNATIKDWSFLALEKYPATHSLQEAYDLEINTLGLSIELVVSSDIDGCDRKMHLISFKELFEIFSKSIQVEERMLLFYLILVENESFRVYVLSRTDQETIYLPILKLIYESMEGTANFSQIYILMVILLILSQDDVNNEAIQKIVVHNVTWFTERPLLKSVSLGGLMTLVLIRTLQLNLSHQKDVYLHTNCLAILSNMSNTMSDMHAYVAQRIISLFEILARRYSKLIEKHSVDVAVYEDLLVLLLEIMSTTLTHRLKHNSQLVYALLQKREIFTPFQKHPRLSDLVQNLEQVIVYFNTRVSEANLKAPSSNEVLSLIEQASRTWSNQNLILLPYLKFQYKEKQDSYEFFIPYIWALVQRRNFIYWSEEKSHVLENYRLMNEEIELQQPPS